jgi:putative transcriptional regulator
MNHHPTDLTLSLFAAGALDDACAAVVATHLSLCADCRRAAADFEAVGAAALEELAPQALAADALESFWSRAGAQEHAGAGMSVPGGDILIPPALRRHVNGAFEGLDWRPFSKGFSQHVLEARGYRPGALRLLKIEPGLRIPKHSHAGSEFTLILKGAYEDELGVFARGDFADLSAEDSHSPRAIGSEDCICLVATDAPLVFRGLVEKAAQRFIGI